MPELNEVVHDGPIAGQSLTAEYGARPWQSPPQYSTLEEALDWYIPKLTDKAFTSELFDIIEIGIPLTTIANSMQLTAVMQGVHSIDIGILITPIVVEMLAYLAEAQDVDFKMGDEESEDDDDKPTEGMLASALTRLKAEDDKPISVPGMDEEVAEVEEEEQQPSGLMARRA